MKLTSLSCGSTEISDLSPLRGMNLKLLYCGNTNVADLSPLQGCTSLEYIYARSTKVTAASVTALQAALPKCKVEWDDPAKPKAK